MLVVDDVSMVYRPPRGLARLVVRTSTTRPVTALRSVSLRVDRGEIVALVGPNGAGKSTLIRAVTTLLRPTRGEVRIDGTVVDPHDPAIRTRFGLALPDDRSHYWRLTGRQNLEFHAALLGLPPALARRRIDELMASRGLAGRDKRVFGYSSGMRAQLSIARALLHDPDLVVLDEPTRSLDPVAAAAVCADLQRLAHQGHAVLMATHRLDEVLETSDRLVVLADGEVRWSGSPRELAADPAGLGRAVRDLIGGTDPGEPPGTSTGGTP